LNSYHSWGASSEDSKRSQVDKDVLNGSAVASSSPTIISSSSIIDEHSD